VVVVVGDIVRGKERCLWGEEEGGDCIGKGKRQKGQVEVETEK